jgi:hypothetical protein
MKADVWPLLLTGDPIPNTANFRFIGFGPAVVNASGTMAFSATFVDPATNLTGNGVFEIAGGQLMPVVMEGQAVPDVPGHAFGVADQPAINNSGDIVFVASLSGYPSSFQAIFEQSGGSLHRVVDFNTRLAAIGEVFSSFSWPQIDDQGDIAFVTNLFAVPGPSVNDEIWMLSGGKLFAVGVGYAASAGGQFSMNNRGDVAFLSGYPSWLSVFSGGSIQSAVKVPQSVPNTSYTVQSVSSPSINYNGDVAFISNSASMQPRGGLLTLPNSIVRWRSGTLEKIVATGDPVPGFNGVVFDTEFLNTQVNQAAMIFTGGMVQNGKPVELLGKSQQGQLTVLATANDYVDGIGTLDSINFPNFDNQQGPLITFLAGAAGGTMSGIYAVTAAQQYTLRFPQIADGGGGAAGGWRTTFVLANRSTTAANATISFFGDTGAPLSLAVGGSPQTQTTVVVPALGVAQVQTQGGGPLTAGWALVQSDQNLSGIAIYGLLDGSGNSVTEVGSPASLPLLSMSVFAQNGATTSTGVALANPNSNPANVTLILRDANSNQLSQTSVTIAAMGHLAEYANQMFSSLPPGEFEGKIDVISTQPLVGLTLRQRGSVFTSLPIIP